MPSKNAKSKGVLSDAIESWTSGAYFFGLQ
jgi:hypothetical protein